jgi:hypothetical protein
MVIGGFMKLSEKDVKFIAEMCVGKTEEQITEVLLNHLNIMLQDVSEDTVPEWATEYGLLLVDGKLI